MEIVDVLAEDRVLPVLVIEDPAFAGDLGAALTAGGARLAEVTLRTATALAAIRALAGVEGLVIGAGTVLNESDVDAAVGAGARFVVSPGLSASVVRRCREHGVVCVPGVATATEIQAALAEGVETVKFFPAREAGGPTMIRALSAPFRSVRFVPTGGVSEANLMEYLAVPSVLAVGGTWLAPAGLVAARDWDEIARRTARALERARSHARGDL
jgi:2-dehydro-3-deoxyphosphogluconate aldolase/(4S)-4-hydroxy-2-oxoglutarate aldolase